MWTPSAAIQRLLALSKLHGVGASTLEKLAQAVDIASCSIDEMAALSPRVRKALEVPSAWSDAQSAADNDLEQAYRSQARIVCAIDPDYPVLLLATSDRPFFLYVQGKLRSNEAKSIAIIGTRNPTEHGRIVCERLTTYFVTNGWSVVSGLALGIDAVAHSSALAARGHTVAVLAHGLHTIAPKQHDRLARQIVDSGGALITEYPFGVEPFPHQFVKRDRIQAGLGKAVIMVQSDKEGGSLHASRAALDYGRDLAIPFPTDRDVEMREPKIAANLLLSSTDDAARATLLNCAVEDLSRVHVLRSRDDYPRLVARLGTTHSPQGFTVQGSLLS